MVPPIPLPISAALLANSDRLGFESPSALPPAAFCESVKRDLRCAPIFDVACLFCACARTDLNSVVRSWMEDTILSDCVAFKILLQLYGMYGMYGTDDARGPI